MDYLPSSSAGAPILITHQPMLAMVGIQISPTTITASFQRQIVNAATGAVVSSDPVESISKSIDAIKNQAVLDAIAVLASKLKVVYDNRTV